MAPCASSTYVIGANGRPPSPTATSNRLRLLRDELTQTVAETWCEYDTAFARLRLERNDIDRALYRQTARLEEHGDPSTLVALATQRIEELSPRRYAIERAIHALEAEQHRGARPAEIDDVDDGHRRFELDLVHPAADQMTKPADRVATTRRVGDPDPQPG